MSSSEATNPRRGPSPMMWISVTLGSVLAISLIVVVSIFTGGSSGTSSAFDNVVPDGQHLSAFHLPGLYVGHVVAPWASGHPTVVVFYASWCAPCAEELPRVAAYAKSHDLGNVRFIGIDANDDLAAGRAFAAHARVTFPSGFDAKGTVTSGTFSLANLPDTVFVNSNGVVSNVVIGPVSNTQLAAGINALR